MEKIEMRRNRAGGVKKGKIVKGAIVERKMIDGG
jgi:hypothetical protein